MNWQPAQSVDFKLMEVDWQQKPKMVELVEIFSVLKFEWAECAAWRSQTVVAAHRRQSATVSGAANINPCVFFCSCRQLRVFRLLCEKCLRRRVTVKNELLTLWQSSVDLDVEVGLLSTLWKIICCHWSTPARVLSSKQALLCKKLTKQNVSIIHVSLPWNE